MKVRAIKLGYYDHLRRKPGAIFEMEDAAAKTCKWVEPLQPLDAAEALPEFPKKKSKKVEPIESDDSVI